MYRKKKVSIKMLTTFADLLVTETKNLYIRHSWGYSIWSVYYATAVLTDSTVQKGKKFSRWLGHPGSFETMKCVMCVCVYIVQPNTNHHKLTCDYFSKWYVRKKKILFLNRQDFVRNVCYTHWQIRNWGVERPSPLSVFRFIRIQTQLEQIYELIVFMTSTVHVAFRFDKPTIFTIY